MEDKNLKVVPADNKKNYQKGCAILEAHFLQSWQWGEFKSEFDWEPCRILLYDKNKLVALGQFLIRKLPLNYYFAYFPMGPVIRDKDKETVNKVIKAISNYLQEKYKKNIFVRYEMPIIEHRDYEYNDNYKNGLKFASLKKSPYDIQVRDTRKLKLSDEREIWEDVFNSNHRRKIRKAFKSNILIEDVKDLKMFNTWYDLNKTTAERGGFFIHPYKYYRTYFEKFIRKDISSLYAAFYNSEMVAGIIVSNYNKESIYQYGASKRLNKNIYVNEALQWHAIKNAINKDSRVYDFWGVAPDEDDRSHPWYGITRFKRKFGGEHIRYVGAYDYPQKPLFYHTFIILEKMRKKILEVKKKFFT